MQIDFLGMHAFLCIVERGGFLQAATQLNLSPAAVSHRIRKLEDGLGTQLLTRTTREVTLTEAGRALLPGIRAAVRELEKSCEALRRHHSAARSWLAFACLPTLASSQLPAPLRRFAGLFPDVSVRVFDDPVSEMTEYVESGVAAFGISVPESHHAGLEVDVFAEEPFLLACPETHPLAARGVARWDDLLDEVLIRISLPVGNSSIIDDALGERRARFRWGYEAQRTVLALDLVAARLGVTVVPALAVGPMPGVVAVPLTEPAITRRLAVVTRRGAQLAPPAQTLCDMVVDGIRTNLGAGFPAG